MIPYWGVPREMHYGLESLGHSQVEEKFIYLCSVAERQSAAFKVIQLYSSGISLVTCY